MADDNRQKVYEIIGSLILQGLVILIIGSGWLMLVYAFIHDTTSWQKGIGAVGGPFALMHIVTRYLFPQRKGKR